MILASDHGHVWHRAESEFEPATEGSRWRQNDGEPKEGEMVIKGKRVLPEESIIVPWTDAVHYKRQQHGYHGGATPQEMVCPLVILRDKSSAYSGLSPCAYPKPEWWSAAPVASPVQVEPVVHVTVPSGQKSLFDPLPPEKEEDSKVVAETSDTTSFSVEWVEKLIDSQAYKDQKAKIKRHPLDDSVVAASLEALVSNGTIMTPIAFAKAAKVTAARLDGMMAQLKRILNVDGYPIITMHRAENKVELNVTKLKRQFDIE